MVYLKTNYGDIKLAICCRTQHRKNSSKFFELCWRPVFTTDGVIQSRDQLLYGSKAVVSNPGLEQKKHPKAPIENEAGTMCVKVTK